MTLHVHNTLTRRLEPFVPIEPGHVRMYVCGITVYDLCHLGHARMMLAFDVVYRWLLALGNRVTYVRNITDIDDKIIGRALERGIPIRALTDEMIAAMHRDLGALGLHCGLRGGQRSRQRRVRHQEGFCGGRHVARRRRAVDVTLCRSFLDRVRAARRVRGSGRRVGFQGLPMVALRR